MQTMNQSLLDLFSKGIISFEEAIGRSCMPEELNAMIQRKSSMAVSGTGRGR
jgi:Tfp pilus assembly ATPase PilU